MGAERMSVNGKEAPILPAVNHLISQYNADIWEAAQVYAKAREDLDLRLKQTLAKLEKEYEEKLLGIVDK